MGSTANGSVAVQWASSSSSNQQWTIETVNGYSKLRNRATGLYLDGMGRTANGSDLGQWSNSSSNNQQWTISNVSNARIASPPVTVEERGNEVGISPNPFTSGITVSVPDPDVVRSIVMIDLTGREVEIIEHDNIKREQIMGTRLMAGLYVVQVNGFKNRKSFKVIKN
jgi:hypothetical protein